MSHKPQLFSGARAVISFKNSAGQVIPMAIATDVSVNTRDNLRPTFVVGNLGPVSIDPLSIDVDCSIGRIVPMSTIIEGGASQVTAIDVTLEDKILDILNADSIEISIVDSITQKTIAIVKEARFSGRSTSLNSGDIANERMNFVGIYDGSYNNQQAADSTGYTS